MRRTFLVLICLSLQLCCTVERPPNIVLIMSDDMGYSDIGCFGGEIETPNLDRLAGNGLRFTQFYNTARCCPTRASLLTGLYPHQAGIGHMSDSWSPRLPPGYAGDLNRNSLTIAEALETVGYRNYAVGKWHVAADVATDGPKHNWPLQRGFDRFYGTIVGAGSFYDPGTLTRGNAAISPFADPEYQPEVYYYTHAISDWAVQFIGDHQGSDPGKPFFLYVAYTTAHWPMHALDRDIQKYGGRYDEGYDAVRRARVEKMKALGVLDPRSEISPTVGDWEAVQEKDWEARGMEVYAAMIDSMDQGIGRIVRILQDTGQLDNTLVFFLQDNGGCAEGVGRQPKMTRPTEPTLPPIAPDAIIADVLPAQTRSGMPVLKGTQIMPGPEDTYIAYGKAWANVSNTPFREYKHWVHEGGIATPLIAHWPRGIPESRQNQLERQPGHLIDIMATCVEVAGVEYPSMYAGQTIHPLEGVSLRSAFEGKELGRPQPIFFEHEGNRAVREGAWKLVAKGPDGAWELYNTELDRAEMKDVAASYPERLKAMVAKWEAWAKRAKVLPWPWEPQYVEGLVGQD